jgi:cell division protein ZapA (FtsZ GTPase activity inhibitor)
MAKNRIRLNILGVDYVISSEEEEPYVRTVASEVEKNLYAIMQENPRVSSAMASVLTALDYCDEAKKANESADNLRSQIKDYLEESSRARMELDEARREMERMKREIQTLRLRLAECDAAAGEKQPEESRAAGHAPAPISRPAPSKKDPVPPQARLYTRPEPLSGAAEEEILSFFDEDKGPQA